MIVDQETVVAALVDAAEYGRTEVQIGGETWAVTIEADGLTPFDIEDDEWMGKVEWVDEHADRWSDYPATRPTWANGRARKIQLRGYRAEGAIWWQPPADLTDEQVPTMARYVKRVFEDGYYVVGVERVAGFDRFSRPVSGDVNWIGGIGPEVFDVSDGRSYLTDVVTDQVAEVVYAEDDTVPAWLTRMVPA